MVVIIVKLSYGGNSGGLTMVYLTWVSMRKARCLFGTNAPSLEEKRSARPEPSPPRPENPLALDGVKFDMSAWGERVEGGWKER